MEENNILQNPCVIYVNENSQRYRKAVIASSTVCPAKESDNSDEISSPFEFGLTPSPELNINVPSDNENAKMPMHKDVAFPKMKEHDTTAEKEKKSSFVGAFGNIGSIVPNQNERKLNGEELEAVSIMQPGSVNIENDVHYMKLRDPINSKKRQKPNKCAACGSETSPSSKREKSSDDALVISKTSQRNSGKSRDRDRPRRNVSKETHSSDLNTVRNYNKKDKNGETCTGNRGRWIGRPRRGTCKTTHNTAEKTLINYDKENVKMLFGIIELKILKVELMLSRNDSKRRVSFKDKAEMYLIQKTIVKLFKKLDSLSSSMLNAQFAGKRETLEEAFESIKLQIQKLISYENAVSEAKRKKPCGAFAVPTLQDATVVGSKNQWRNRSEITDLQHSKELEAITLHHELQKNITDVWHSEARSDATTTLTDMEGIVNEKGNLRNNLQVEGADLQISEDNAMNFKTDENSEESVFTNQENNNPYNSNEVWKNFDGILKHKEKCGKFTAKNKCSSTSTENEACRTIENTEPRPLQRKRGRKKQVVNEDNIMKFGGRTNSKSSKRLKINDSTSWSETTQNLSDDGLEVLETSAGNSGKRRGRPRKNKMTESTARSTKSNYNEKDENGVKLLFGMIEDEILKIEKMLNREQSKLIVDCKNIADMYLLQKSLAKLFNRLHSLSSSTLISPELKGKKIRLGKAFESVKFRIQELISKKDSTTNNSLDLQKRAEIDDWISHGNIDVQISEDTDIDIQPLEDTEVEIIYDGQRNGASSCKDVELIDITEEIRGEKRFFKCTHLPEKNHWKLKNDLNCSDATVQPELKILVECDVLKPGYRVLTVHSPQKLHFASITVTGHIRAECGELYCNLRQWCLSIPIFCQRVPFMTTADIFDRVYYQGRCLSFYKEDYDNYAGYIYPVCPRENRRVSETITSDSVAEL